MISFLKMVQKFLQFKPMDKQDSCSYLPFENNRSAIIYNLVTGQSLDGATISGYYTEYSTVFTCFAPYSNVQLNAILGISDLTTYMAFGNIAIERLR